MRTIFAAVVALNQFLRFRPEAPFSPPHRKPLHPMGDMTEEILGITTGDQVGVQGHPGVWEVLRIIHGIATLCRIDDAESLSAPLHTVSSVKLLNLIESSER